MRRPWRSDRSGDAEPRADTRPSVHLPMRGTVSHLSRRTSSEEGTPLRSTARDPTAPDLAAARRGVVGECQRGRRAGRAVGGLPGVDDRAERVRAGWLRGRDHDAERQPQPAPRPPRRRRHGAPRARRRPHLAAVHRPPDRCLVAARAVPARGLSLVVGRAVRQLADRATGHQRRPAHRSGAALPASGQRRTANRVVRRAGSSPSWCRRRSSSLRCGGRWRHDCGAAWCAAPWC